MKTIILCLVGAFVVSFGFLSNLQQQDDKAEIKRKRRDTRHSDPNEKNRLISDMGDGQVRHGIADFVDLSGYDDQKTEEAKNAIRDKLTTEQTAQRKTVFCDSTVIIWGKVKDYKGYITSDDTAIYTVYQFVINDVYRAPRSLVFNAGSEIEVAIPGGFAKTKSGKLVGVRSSLYPYLAKSQTYVLALKYDVEADDYYPFNPIGIYRITPEGQAVRGDAMHKFLARRSYLAREPATFSAVIDEIKSLTCSQ
jgi:hypothetical protein